MNEVLTQVREWLADPTASVFVLPALGALAPLVLAVVAVLVRRAFAVLRGDHLEVSDSAKAFVRALDSADDWQPGRLGRDGGKFTRLGVRDYPLPNGTRVNLPRLEVDAKCPSALGWGGLVITVGGSDIDVTGVYNRRERRLIIDAVTRRAHRVLAERREATIKGLHARASL